MKSLMKHAVDTVYKLLELRSNDPEKYARFVASTVTLYAYKWDDPEPQK
jgi:hypothetical protein